MPIKAGLKAGLSNPLKIGDKIDKLTILGFYDKKYKNKICTYAICECDCENIIERSTDHLRWKNKKFAQCRDCRNAIRPLTDDEKDFITPYFKWAEKMVGYFKRKYPHIYYEVESGVMYALILAVIKYDRTKGNQFRNFATYKMISELNTLSDLKKTELKKQREIDLELYVKNEKQFDVDVEIDLSCLDERSKEIIKLKFYDNLEWKEVAEKVDLSRERVSRIYHKDLKTLRETVNAY